MTPCAPEVRHVVVAFWEMPPGVGGVISSAQPLTKSRDGKVRSVPPIRGGRFDSPTL